MDDQQPEALQPPMTVALESPFLAKSDQEARTHAAYNVACLLESLSRGEAPFAYGGTLLCRVLKDHNEQQTGIVAGAAVAARLQARVFYVDLGMDRMMHGAKTIAKAIGQTILEDRRVPGWCDECWGQGKLRTNGTLPGFRRCTSLKCPVVLKGLVVA